MLGAAGVQIAFNMGNALGAYFGWTPPIAHGDGNTVLSPIGSSFCGYRYL